MRLPPSRWPGSAFFRAARPPRRLAAERGFTLIELVVVVIIIGIFSVMALPQITHQLRDRRVQETAHRVALIYQQARTRAMGQGGAVMVRYTDADHGTFETLEALVGVGGKCEDLPATSCTQTNWTDDAKHQFRGIETLKLEEEPALDNVFATLASDGSPDSSNTFMEVCFTPLGRSFVRYDSTSSGGVDTGYRPLAGVPVFSVFRGKDSTTPIGLTRHVLVLPTGIARLRL